MSAWQLFKLWFKVRILEHRVCPSCGEVAPFGWRKLSVVFEDEPPMFCEMWCKRCGWRSGILPTRLTDDAVRKLGFDGFDDYYERVVKPKMEVGREEEGQATAP